MFGPGGEVMQQCRNCGSPARTLEVAGGSGEALFLPFTPEFEATLGEDFSYDGSEPRWLCRFLDARACPNCGACDLAAHDPATYLECDGPHLPRSARSCPACNTSCLGPLAVECFGVPGPPLAYLAPKFGAPLIGRLCSGCGRVWLSLNPDDAEARRELVTRFADSGPCGLCGMGRLRATRVDVPHGGFAGLFDPSSPSGSCGAPAWAADLMVVVCDKCGESEPRANWQGLA
jgi:hypothetical protein